MNSPRPQFSYRLLCLPHHSKEKIPCRIAVYGLVVLTGFSESSPAGVPDTRGHTAGELVVKSLIEALREFPCLYASRAEIHCFSQLAFASDDQRSWDRFLLSVAALITEFADSADVLAVELPVRANASPRHLLAQVTHSFLSGLVHYCNEDPAQLYTGIESAKWECTLMNRDFFPLVLSPVYPIDHPRHVRWRQPVILLQPEASFTRHGISSLAQGRKRISAATEQAFLKAGKPYYGHITRDLPKSFRVIKPVSETDLPIRWWETVTVTVTSPLHST